MGEKETYIVNYIVIKQYVYGCIRDEIVSVIMKIVKPWYYNCDTKIWHCDIPSADWRITFGKAACATGRVKPLQMLQPLVLASLCNRAAQLIKIQSILQYDMEAYVGLDENENMNIKMQRHNNIDSFKMCMCYLSKNSNENAIIQFAFSFSNTKCDHINLKMKSC